KLIYLLEKLQFSRWMRFISIIILSFIPILTMFYDILNILVLAFCIIILSFAIILFIFLFIGILGKKKIYINNDKISLIYELFGIKHLHPSPSYRQDILRLERSKDIYNQPSLTIWAGSKNYEILTGEFYVFPVTPPELDWLAYELSDWLGLPITRE
ncbi:MAG: hypothetical protein RM049_35610, partial [Nostoc sp. DedQUE04]|nr:hypothetical protein [Nostoc sp. DedQUE04]